MSHRALGQQLAQAIDTFHAANPHLADPNKCYGECGNATDDFIQHAAKHGVEGIREVHYEGRYTPGLSRAHPEWAKYGDKEYLGHIVAEHQGHTIDWTARQFDHTAPHPRIVPSHVTDSEWDEHSGEFNHLGLM